MATPNIDESLRIAAETLLRSHQTEQVQSPTTDVSRSYSINTVPSVPAEYVISEDILAGSTSQGRMSNVRRFFCLFVTFDLAFTGLMWLICIMINGENIRQAINTQIYQYTIHTSLFDVVLAAFSRFIILLLFYGLICLNHWIIIALSTTATCAFLIVKVFQYNWVDSHQPVFEVLLILTSFVISWGEAWFLDFRVIPQELHARRFFVSNGPVENERAPLIRSYVQGLPSMYTESVGNFYSPLCSPEGSIYGGDHTHRGFAPIRLTKEQEEDHKSRAAKTAQDAWKLLNSSEWKLEKTNSEKDTVHVLSVPKAGKMFKLTAVVNIAPRYLLDELFYKVENIPQWNPALLESYKVQSFDEYTDITYQISADAAGIITSRDFVNFRHWRLIEGGYIIAYTSYEHPSVPKNDKYIRGENGIGCWVMKPIPGESDKCQFQWVLNTNLKGWIPQYILDPALISMMLDYVKHLRKYIIKMGESGQTCEVVYENV